MKIHIRALLPGLCLLVLGLTLGFYLGRGMDSSDLSAAVLPRQPLQDEAPEISYAEGSYVTFPVDINTAGVYELTALPGIGETLAIRIVRHREAAGPFPNPEALLNVEGIGPATLEAILPQITTGG